MNDEQRKQVAILSARFFTEFGVADDGRLKFQWMRTDEMPTLFGRGFDMEGRTESGIWVPRRKFKRATVADTYGNGLCWTVAKLETPSIEGWRAVFGDEVPWPAKGYYRPIDNVVLAIEVLPDEEVSARAAHALRNHLCLSIEDFDELVAQENAAINRNYQTKVADMVEDATPAFGNDPGGKGHVSFPSIS